MRVTKYTKSKMRINGEWINDGSGQITPIGMFGGKPKYADVIVGQTFTLADDTFKSRLPSHGKIVYKLYVNSDFILYRFASEADYLANNSFKTTEYTNWWNTHYFRWKIKCGSGDSKDDDKHTSIINHSWNSGKQLITLTDQQAVLVLDSGFKIISP